MLSHLAKESWHGHMVHFNDDIFSVDTYTIKVIEMEI
jgi:hypothetical protein